MATLGHTLSVCRVVRQAVSLEHRHRVEGFCEHPRRTAIPRYQLRRRRHVNLTASWRTSESFRGGEKGSGRIADRAPLTDY